MSTTVWLVIAAVLFAGWLYVSHRRRAQERKYRDV